MAKAKRIYKIVDASSSSLLQQHVNVYVNKYKDTEIHGGLFFDPKASFRPYKQAISYTPIAS